MTDENDDNESVSVDMPLFRDDISTEEAETMQSWARDNYEPHTPIKGIWHPLVQEECTKMNSEHGLRITTDDDEISIETVAIDKEDDDYNKMIFNCESWIAILATSGPSAIPSVLNLMRQYIIDCEDKEAEEDG